MSNLAGSDSKLSNALRPSCCFGDGIVPLAEQFRDRPFATSLRPHEEHCPERLHEAILPARVRQLRRRGLHLAGQMDDKRAARPGSALDFDRAAQPANDPLNGGKPQPATHKARCEERIEYPRLCLRGHAAARIPNLQADTGAEAPPTGCARRRQDNRSGLPSSASDALMIRFMTTWRISDGLARIERQVRSKLGLEDC